MIVIYTRSQAVAWVAYRPASQHLWVHVTSSVTWPCYIPYAVSYWWSFRTKPLSLTVSEILIVECNAMVDMTLIRTLTKIKFVHFGTNRFVICEFLYTVNSNFCSRTHRLATIHNITNNRQTQHCTLILLVGSFDL